MSRDCAAIIGFDGVWAITGDVADAASNINASVTAKPRFLPKFGMLSSACCRSILTGLMHFHNPWRGPEFRFGSGEFPLLPDNQASFALPMETLARHSACGNNFAAQRLFR